MKILTIAAFNLLRLFRERSNLFFVIILPLMLILLLGSAFGGASTPHIGIYDAADDARSQEIVAALEDNGSISVSSFDREDSLVDAVSSGDISAGIVIPQGFASTVEGGGTAEIRYFGRPDSVAPQLASTVSAAIARQNIMLRAALFAQQETGATLAQARSTAEQIAPELPSIDVQTQRVGEDVVPDDGGFNSVASAQLLLFVFLISLNSSVALIQTRRLGVAKRMLSTPTSAVTIVAGETAGRYAISLTQALIIMGGSSLFFGVSWGDLTAATALVLVFALVSTGAGLLLGAVFSSEQQAGAIALLLGLGMAAFGGSMVPLEFFPDTIRTLAHITPHAWGNEAFTILLQEDGGIADIARQIGILLAYATGLLFISAWFLRRRLVSA